VVCVNIDDDTRARLVWKKKGKRKKMTILSNIHGVWGILVAFVVVLLNILFVLKKRNNRLFSSASSSSSTPSLLSDSNLR
jgi:hypothetical protein